MRPGLSGVAVPEEGVAMKTTPARTRPDPAVALRAIVDLKARGWTRPEICQFLSISERTLFRRERAIQGRTARPPEPEP
jgi:hypothetical protein